MECYIVSMSSFITCFYRYVMLSIDTQNDLWKRGFWSNYPAIATSAPTHLNFLC